MRGSDPPGREMQLLKVSRYQGDLHFSPLFQVGDSDSVLDGWRELVQKRGEIKKMALKDNLMVKLRNRHRAQCRETFWFIPVSV